MDMENCNAFCSSTAYTDTLQFNRNNDERNMKLHQ